MTAPGTLYLLHDITRDLEEHGPSIREPKFDLIKFRRYAVSGDYNSFVRMWEKFRTQVNPCISDQYLAPQKSDQKDSTPPQKILLEHVVDEARRTIGSGLTPGRCGVIFELLNVVRTDSPMRVAVLAAVKGIRKSSIRKWLLDKLEEPIKVYNDGKEFEDWEEQRVLLEGNLENTSDYINYLLGKNWFKKSNFWRDIHADSIPDGAAGNGEEKEFTPLQEFLHTTRSSSNNKPISDTTAGLLLKRIKIKQSLPGYKPDEPNPDGLTDLMCAALVGGTLEVERSLQMGARHDIATGGFLSALEIAVKAAYTFGAERYAGVIGLLLRRIENSTKVASDDDKSSDVVVWDKTPIWKDQVGPVLMGAQKKKIEKSKLVDWMISHYKPPGCPPHKAVKALCEAGAIVDVWETKEKENNSGSNTTTPTTTTTSKVSSLSRPTNALMHYFRGTTQSSNAASKFLHGLKDIWTGKKEGESDAIFRLSEAANAIVKKYEVSQVSWENTARWGTVKEMRALLANLPSKFHENNYGFLFSMCYASSEFVLLLLKRQQTVVAAAESNVSMIFRQPVRIPSFSLRDVDKAPILGSDTISWLTARQASDWPFTKQEVSKILAEILMPRDAKCGGYSEKQILPRLGELAKFKGKTRVVDYIIDKAERMFKKHKSVERLNPAVKYLAIALAGDISPNVAPLFAQHDEMKNLSANSLSVYLRDTTTRPDRTVAHAALLEKLRKAFVNVCRGKSPKAPLQDERQTSESPVARKLADSMNPLLSGSGTVHAAENTNCKDVSETEVDSFREEPPRCDFQHGV